MTWEEWVKLIQQQYPTEGAAYPNEFQYARSLREKYDDPQLANAEHYLFGRMQTRENPMMALGAFVNPPAYYLAKQLGLMSGRSQPSLEQLMAGSRGYLSGLWD
jgi:hypothetical protein